MARGESGVCRELLISVLLQRGLGRDSALLGQRTCAEVTGAGEWCGAAESLGTRIPRMWTWELPPATSCTS